MTTNWRASHDVGGDPTLAGSALCMCLCLTQSLNVYLNLYLAVFGDFETKGWKLLTRPSAKGFVCCVLCVVCCVLCGVLSCLVLSVTPTVHYRKAATYDAAKTNIPAN